MDRLDILIIGAGAAGLIAAKDLAQAGFRPVILEARPRIGGRILPLPMAEFGYAAEGGAEFVHGRAPITRALIAEAGLTTVASRGEAWRFADGRLERYTRAWPEDDRFNAKLAALTHDLPVAEFLETEFADPEFAELRRSVLRMIEGYDAADPKRASTLALRDRWLEERDEQSRIVEGYGALLDHLARDVPIRLGQEVRELRIGEDEVQALCADGATHRAGVAIVTVPPPALDGIRFEPGLPPVVAAAIGRLAFGDVLKLVLSFRRALWASQARMSFLFSDLEIPTWWTQAPRPHPVLTGWLAGPRLARIDAPKLADPLALGVATLSRIFAMTEGALNDQLAAANVIRWSEERFSRCAYSYATVETRAALHILAEPIHGRVLLAGEALYQDGELGTVEAAFANGRAAAAKIIARS